MTVGHAQRVYKAINEVMREMSLEGISKDRRNTQGNGYNFRGIDDVMNALSTKLSKYGLCILPRVLERECIERQSKAGGALFYTTLKVEFDFVSSEDGSKHTVVTVGEAMDSGDKSSNKAMSAALKYACLQVFAIPTEGDNDTENNSHEPLPVKKQAPKQEQKQVQQGKEIDYGEFQMPIGRQKGTKFCDIKQADLLSAKAWIDSKNDGGKWNDTLDKINKYLNQEGYLTTTIKEDPQAKFGAL